MKFLKLRKVKVEKEMEKQKPERCDMSGQSVPGSIYIPIIFAIQLEINIKSICQNYFPPSLSRT